MKVDDIKSEPIEYLVQQAASRRTSSATSWTCCRTSTGGTPRCASTIRSSRRASRPSSWRSACRRRRPRRFEVEKESEATKKLYGLDDDDTRAISAGSACSRGAWRSATSAYIQCTHSYKWDQHSDLFDKHTENAKEVDKPIAGLLKDLKARGLLKDTLVIWAGEFGRTPVSQGGNGRDHNPYGYTIWMAGGGVKPGFIYGATDDIGYHAVEDRMHIHDFHATVLHLLGLDHEKLTYKYSGRDFRLTDVAGVVAQKILA